MTKQRSTAMIIKRTIIFFGLFVFTAVANASRGLPDFTDLVETYGPAVVNISTIQKKKISKREELRRHMPDMPEGGPFGEWFKRFF
jgi:serine protease Do